VEAATKAGKGRSILNINMTKMHLLQEEIDQKPTRSEKQRQKDNAPKEKRCDYGLLIPLYISFDPADAIDGSGGTPYVKR